MLVDDGMSSNGTYVNEERVSGRHHLTDGDVVRFGRTAAAYRSPAQRTPAASEQRAPSPSTPHPGAVPSPDAVGLSTTQRRVLVALCRPYKDRGTFATPAADEQIAEELVPVGRRGQGATSGCCTRSSGSRVRPDRRRESASPSGHSPPGLISERDL